MSDIIRRLSGLTERDPRVVGATTKELARLAHLAEDTGDDVLLVDVWAELDDWEARLPGATDRFREWYIELHRPAGRKWVPE